METDTDIKQAKRLLRKQIKRSVAQLSGKEKLIISEIIFSNIESLPEFKKAQTVLVYWALPDEVQTRDFIIKSSKTKRIILPVVDGENLLLCRFESEEKMSYGSFNILEPNRANQVQPSEIDLAIIPGLAFDEQNNRLGRGKGFYDRILDEISAPKIGVCFAEQYVKHIPTEPFDKKVDSVIVG